MDRLDELSIFVAIIDTGSLAGAARQLRRSRPAVTRALAALERRAGVSLIARTTRQLMATEAGRELAASARRILSEYDASLSDVAGAPVRGVLRITAPLAFGRRHVTPIVAEFLDLHPEVQVELTLSDRNLDLIEEGLDLAVRIGALPNSRLVARKVGEVRRVLVASPDYLARRGIPQRPSDLAGHDTIASIAAGQTLFWRFAGSGRDAGVTITPRLIVNEVESVLIAARSGRGLARALSYQVAPDLAEGTLIRLLREWEPAAAPVQLVVPGGQQLASKVRVFLDHAVARLQQLPVIRPEPGA
ncbi:MAG: LysR family transcriptional regulator [Bosea sp.]|uniref:LysR family transcriptional regulator n=1 Tax=Bosea sp. (in: a-proteobacteria) TaxID=1871050 RepID=UPI001ACA507E|nr:LysR family transcriptional regulator [Bosea sp. (in: a-proteobacteria)]MBN9470089.1 LysR family transcriptional regulator [Bosea sp. (in: a-proteobacteria)]